MFHYPGPSRIGNDCCSYWRVKLPGVLLLFLRMPNWTVVYLLTRARFEGAESGKFSYKNLDSEDEQKVQISLLDRNDKTIFQADGRKSYVIARRRLVRQPISDCASFSGTRKDPIPIGKALEARSRMENLG